MAFQKLIPALMAGNSVDPAAEPAHADLLADLRCGGRGGGTAARRAQRRRRGRRRRRRIAHAPTPRSTWCRSPGRPRSAEQILAQAAPTVKRVALELGGKSAQIYLPDAVDRVGAGAQARWSPAPRARRASRPPACWCPGPQGRRARRGAAAYAALDRRAARPSRGAMMGPVISAGPARPVRTLRRARRGARRQGRRPAGGRPAELDRGYYFEPTVLDLPDNANPAAQEEIFGPVHRRPRRTTTSTTRCASPTTASTACRRRCTAPTSPPRPLWRDASRPARSTSTPAAVQRLRTERRLQAERPRPRAGSRRHPRVPRGQAPGDRRATR